MRNFGLPVVCLVSFLGLFQSGSAAFKSITISSFDVPCNEYAEETMKQVSSGASYGCGFSPTDYGWNSERSIHFNWCVSGLKDGSVHEADLNSSLTDRDTKLTQCQANADKYHTMRTNLCPTFTERSTRMAKIYPLLECSGGDTGGAFNLDSSVHSNWCSNLDVAQLGHPEWTLLDDHSEDLKAFLQADLDAKAATIYGSQCSSMNHHF